MVVGYKIRGGKQIVARCLILVSVYGEGLTFWFLLVLQVSSWYKNRGSEIVVRKERFGLADFSYVLD